MSTLKDAMAASASPPPTREDEEEVIETVTESTTSQSFYRTDDLLKKAAAGTVRRVKVFLTANKLSYQQISFSCMKCNEVGRWKNRVLQLELGLGILRSVKRGVISNEFHITDIKRMTKKDGRRFVLIIDFTHYHPYKGYIADKKLPYDPPPWMPNEIQQEISLSKADGENKESDRIQSGFMTIVYPYVYQGSLRTFKAFHWPQWVGRKVCICHEKMYIYLSDGIESKSPEMLLPLDEHTVEPISTTRFVVKLAGRSFKFEADTEELRDRWIAAIEQPQGANILQ